MKRSYIREILDAINEDTISFAGGLPNEDIFPLAKLQEASKRVFEDKNSLQYSKSQGIDTLREKLANLYTTQFDLPTTKDEILITTGSQQAFDIIIKTIQSEELVVERPSYIGALNAFNILNMKMKDFENIKQLDAVLKQESVFYCVSDYQNPSTNTYTQIQREKLATVLEQNSAYLIEDGAYSLLNFKGKIEKPISAFYKDKSYHLGSFSKIIAPGLRVGWIRASKELLDKVLVAKESLDLHTSTFNQMLINEYLEENCIFEHAKYTAKDYEERMQFMSSCMKKYLPTFEYKEPKGGMFIYGKFNNVEDSMKLAKKALDKNVAFVPAQVFYYDGKISNEARFNFTNCSFDKIEQGIKTLAKLV